MFNLLVSAQLVRVWRDANSGLVYQRGGFLYLGVLLGLVVLRLLLHFVLDASGIAASTNVLNDTLIAMAIGDFLGRAINVGMRSLALNGWSYNALPNK